jgi:hypothetical protein
MFKAPEINILMTSLELTIKKQITNLYLNMIIPGIQSKRLENKKEIKTYDLEQCLTVLIIVQLLESIWS